MTSNGKKTSTSTTLTVPAAKRLSVGETDDGLVKIEIQLRKFRLWVIESSLFTRFKISSLVTELMKDIGEPEEYEARVRANLITEVWAPLSVCSEGEVPTVEQFLVLPDSDLSFWVETAKELGHSFEWLDGLNRVYEAQAQALELDQKKKGRDPENLSSPLEVGSQEPR